MKRAILTGVLTIAVFFGGLGTWSMLAPLDSAVIGVGALEVRGNTKTVQHRDGGIVAALLVRDGSVVQQGQLLVRLDGTQARAVYDVHRSELLGDEALSARDLAELSGAAAIDFPKDLKPDDPVAAAVMNREGIVFRNHVEMLARQLDVVDQRVVQARAQEDGAKEQLASMGRQLALAVQELEAVGELAKVGLAPKNHMLELERGVESLRGQLGQMSSDVARFGSEAVELQAEKLRLRQAAQSNATHELRDAQLRINDVLPRLAADRDLLKRLDIRAPIAGQVVNLAIFTKGGVIEPGKPIMDIVPSAPTLVAEAHIRPEDVEHLRVGQAAQVIATGFSLRSALPIDGKVTVISADRETDPRTGRSYFKAEIALVADHQGGALLRQLGPGMPVEVIVPTKARTAFDYLVGPLRQSFRGALRES
ncbi:MAG TPA: HlyD family type I secretion periplasmic adaptor subunit [Acetobacteraceae bacterium]|nr:HlyD family type I secretion periplasmic adaptor subunit [Acetobacteraceae bacterium]